MSDCRFGVSPVIYPDPDPGLQVAFKRTKMVPATMNESGVSQQNTVSLF